MRSKTKIILVIAALAIGVLGWFGYRLTWAEARVGRVARGIAVHAVPANVVVSAESTMEIKCKLGGRVIKRQVKKGQEVKANDLLFEIDGADLQLQIEQAEAEKKALQARMDVGSPIRFEIATAEENLRTATRMFETGRMSQVDFDRAKRGLQALKDKLAYEDIDNHQKLDMIENELKQKQLALKEMNIITYVDGTVIDLPTEPGDLVGNGQILARVISRSRLVEAQISEENFAGVRSGLPVVVQFLGYYGQTYKGKVEGVIASADEKTKRYTAYLKMDMSEEALTPGLTGDASITINQHDNALKVERSSLVGGVDGYRLYVVRNGRVQIVPVEIGFLGQKYAEVLSGVKEGDEYILDILTNFRDGQRVSVVELSARN